jgi:hypothetical protein
MEQAPLTYRCSCGEVAAVETQEAGDLRRCTACRETFMVPFVGQRGAAPEDSATKRSSRMEVAPPTDDVRVDYGATVPSSYEPSGRVGSVLVLATFGALAVVAGLVAAALVAGGWCSSTSSTTFFLSSFSYCRYSSSVSSL